MQGGRIPPLPRPSSMLSSTAWLARHLHLLLLLLLLLGASLSPSVVAGRAARGSQPAPMVTEGHHFYNSTNSGEASSLEISPRNTASSYSVSSEESSSVHAVPAKTEWLYPTSSVEASSRDQNHDHPRRSSTSSGENSLLKFNSDQTSPYSTNTGETNSLGAYPANASSLPFARSGETVSMEPNLVNTLSSSYISRTAVQTSEVEDVNFQLHLSNCSVDRIVTVYGARGSIWGLYHQGDVYFTDEDMCKWSIQMPSRYRYMHLLVTMPEGICFEKYMIRTAYSPEDLATTVPVDRVWRVTCAHRYRQIFVASSQYYFVLYHSDLKALSTLPTFRVDFQGYEEDVRQSLNVTPPGPQRAGIITSWGFSWMWNHLCFNNATFSMITPPGLFILISFPRFDMHGLWNNCPEAGIRIYSVSNKRLVLAACGSRTIETFVYPASMLIQFRTQQYCHFSGSGFKARYSFLPPDSCPQRLSNFLFNCSTPQYPSFREHLDCNLEYECDGGEDETGQCPYSSPQCRGLVSAGDKCYQHVYFEYALASWAAQRQCMERSGDLAMMKTDSDWEAVRKIYQHGRRYHRALIGLRSGDSAFPDLYRYTLKWLDGTMAHNVHLKSNSDLLASFYKEHEQCGVLVFGQKLEVQFEHCIKDVFRNFICQVTINKPASKPVTFPVAPFNASLAQGTGQWLTACLPGHVTHAFLSCDPQCTLDQQVTRCTLPSSTSSTGAFSMAMFACQGSTPTLPYALLCNFRPDCQDGADEAFCVHGARCEGFHCRSGQCVAQDKRCNMYHDCLDRSDEEDCHEFKNPVFARFMFPPLLRLPPPVRLDYSRDGHIAQTAMREDQPCPDTHLGCPQRYCLPVFLRCNGFKDCPGGEDEVDCNLYTCPGFYRCWSSRVCVHVSHLCDGWPQCPQHDDEWLCGFHCPYPCSCQGHAFRCPGAVELSLFPQLRYLDAKGSGMEPAQVSGLPYLIWLSLAACQVREFVAMTLPNLRTLDLSRNLITVLHLAVLTPLSNLRTLHLSDNPLASMWVPPEGARHSSVRVLDLSLVGVDTLTCPLLALYPGLTHLNISFNNMDTLCQHGFAAVPHLQVVDLRGNPLTSQAPSLLLPLRQLHSVFTDDYRLCCQQFLPDTFAKAEGRCVSPQTVLSSCEDLLRHSSHRTVLLLITVLGTLSNAVCLLAKLGLLRDAFSSCSDIVLTNLAAMDLLMAVYALVIVVADRIFRSRYLSMRHEWMASAACRSAGVAASLSYQATGLAFNFLTLCGLLATCRRSQSLCVTRRGAGAACVLIWTLAGMLSLLPVFKPSWHFHGHSDACMSLPWRQASREGQLYGMAVMVFLPLLLSVLTGAGQLFLHGARFLRLREDHAALLDVHAQDRRRQVQDIARHFPQVALDCARRVALAVAAVLEHAGLHMPSEVRALIFVVLLPSTCAANPLLYALGSLLARRRRQAEQRLLITLHRKLALQKKMVGASGGAGSGGSARGGRSAHGTDSSGDGGGGGGDSSSGGGGVGNGIGDDRVRSGGSGNNGDCGGSSGDGGIPNGNGDYGGCSSGPDDGTRKDSRKCR